MNENTIRFVKTQKGFTEMTEWNTPIFYYVDDEINRRKTVKALAKFYSAYYARIAVSNLKRNINERLTPTAH